MPDGQQFAFREPLANTYSIVAHDADTGQIGVAVQTHQVGVGRLVPWLRPGVGAIATQSLVNISYGPNGLDLLAHGQSPQNVLNTLTNADPSAHHRQVGIVDAQGHAAAFTGEHCIAHAGHHIGDGYTVHANMMVNPGVIDAMRDAYEAASGELSLRLMEALCAAQSLDGDIRGMQSAALIVVPSAGENVDPWTTVYDLRVDEHESPLDELARLLRFRRAKQLSDSGEFALQQGNLEQALNLWEQARDLAPEQEELAFWQAVALADTISDVTNAAEIFNAAFQNDPLRHQWIDLITRLENAKLIQREGTAAELTAAIQSAT